jgi:hypothetical protein
VIGVEIGADVGVDARGALAYFAGALVAAGHAVHVGRGAAKVGEIALEVGHLDDLFHFAQDAFFRSTYDKFALMGRDGAEGTAAETALVQVDREFDHLVGRDALVFVFGMGQAGVGQVEGGVELGGGEHGVGGIDDDVSAIYGLEQPLGVHFVGFFFDVAEVVGLGFFVAQAFFVTVEKDVLLADSAGHVVLVDEEDGLRNVVDAVDGSAGSNGGAELQNGFFTHAVEDDVGPGVAEDATAHAVLPVVVVGEAAHGGFDSAEDDGHVGEEAFENLGVDDGGIVGAAVVSAVGTVGVFRSKSLVGGVFVDHRVHAARGDAEEEPWAAQLFEVAEVAVPVGLRHDGHLIARSLETSPDDGRSERGMVYVGIAREENDV